MLDGRATTLGQLSPGPALIANVASRCGLTPQYGALESLARQYAGDGLTVIGAPCNQFNGQEPDSAQAISTFCSTTYGVSFPLTNKLEVNGPGQHPLFTWLTAFTGADGHSGKVRWNFEKWVVDADGIIRCRFAPTVPPDHPEVVEALRASLAAHASSTASRR